MPKQRYLKLPEAVKAESGYFLCRCGCGREALPPRRTWFSKECVHEYLLRSDGKYIRKCVFKRDRGVCTACGFDCHAAEKYLEVVRIRFGLPLMADKALELGIDDYEPGRSYWMADHIQPVWNGGGLCGLDNFQTLCLKCHKMKSRAETKQRTARKSTKKRYLNLPKHRRRR